LYGYIVKLLIRRALRRHQSGDVEALLRSYADDVRFVFPAIILGWRVPGKGSHRALAEAISRRRPEGPAARDSRRRPPWNTTGIRITDRATDAGGNVIYENRALLFGKIRWGKITFCEVYEDTEKVAALDAYLAGR
jgi:hypothetical protein